MMRRYRFLTSPRWLGLIVAAVVLSVVCTMLGYWQLTRHLDRVEQVELVRTNFDRDPVPVREVVPSAGAELDEAQQWRPVRVEGEYLGDSLVLPQRGVAGNAADHVVGMFRAQVSDDEHWLILVDRGWYPTDSFTDHSALEALPQGPVELVLRLQPAEGPSPRVLAEGQIHRLNPEQGLAAVTGDAEVTGTLAQGFYGQLAAESQAGSDVVPEGLALLPRPDADLGSHLSYALQWWVFALGLYVALVVLARREARDGTSGPGRKRRRDQDEDDEVESQIQARATSSA